MKNFYIILILFLSFTIYSCAKKSDTSSSTSNTEIEGIWVVICYDDDGVNYLIKTLIITDTEWVDNIEIHTDSSCPTDKDKWEFTNGSLQLVETGTSGSSPIAKFTMTRTTIRHTPQTSELASWGNTNSWCGETDWELNTAQDIAGKTCASSTQWATNTTIYGLHMLVDGSTLYWCVDNEDHPSSCSTFSSNAFIKQKNLIFSLLAV